MRARDRSRHLMAQVSVETLDTVPGNHDDPPCRARRDTHAQCRVSGSAHTRTGCAEYAEPQPSGTAHAETYLAMLVASIDAVANVQDIERNACAPVEVGARLHVRFLPASRT